MLFPLYFVLLIVLCSLSCGLAVIGWAIGGPSQLGKLAGSAGRPRRATLLAFAFFAFHPDYNNQNRIVIIEYRVVCSPPSQENACEATRLVFSIWTLPSRRWIQHLGIKKLAKPTEQKNFSRLIRFE